MSEVVSGLQGKNLWRGTGVRDLADEQFHRVPYGRGLGRPATSPESGSMWPYPMRS